MFRRRRSFTIIEIILAMGIFALAASGIAGVVVQAFSINRLGEEESYAGLLSTEGTEAARAVVGRDFFNLVNGSHGLDSSSGRWEFSGTSNSFGKFTRRIVVSNVFRDENNNVVTSGGILDIFTKRVDSVVTWNFTPGRDNEVSVKTYFTFWQAPICEWGDALIQVGGLNLPGPAGATDIEVDEEGEWGYVTGLKNSQGGEFYILDLADPLNPEIEGSYEANSDLNAVSVSGNFAYLASAANPEILVINITVPSAPVLAGSNELPIGAALDIQVSDGYLYAGLRNNTGDELYIYDLVNPVAPAFVGSLDVAKDVAAISVADGRAYLATTATGQSDAKSLIVVDVSDPANPVELGSYATELAGAKGKSVYYEGGIVHLTTSANAGPVEEYYILDASDPANIYLVGSLDVQHAVNSVETGTTFALLATDTNSKAIMVVDITPPTNPQEVFSLPLNGSGIGTAINGCYAFVASTDNNQEIKVVTPD